MRWRRSSTRRRRAREPAIRRREAGLLLALTIPHFAVTLFAQAPGLVAPWLIEDLGMTRTQLGFLAGIRFLASSLVFLVSGVLVSRWGISRGLVIALVGYGILSSAAAASPGFLMMMLCFLGSGLVFALVHPATTDGIMKGFAPSRLGTVMGVKETGVPVAGIVATVALPFIALHGGWRIAFLACGLVPLVLAWPVWFLLRVAPWANVRSTPDPEYRWHTAFTRSVVVSGVLQLLLLGVQFCLLSYLFLYLVDAVRLSLPLAALCIACTQVGSFIWRFGSGIVADRLFAGRHDIVLALNFLTIAASLVLLTGISATTPTLALIALTVLLGGSTQGWVGSLLLFRSSLAPTPESIPSVTAAGFVVGCWGAIVVAPLFGLAVDVTESFRFAWLATAALYGTVGAVMLAIVARRTSDAGGEPR